MPGGGEEGWGGGAAAATLVGGGASPVHPAQAAIARIDRWLDGAYPELGTSWSGMLEVVPTRELPGAAGAKASSCDIVIRRDVADSIPRRYSTLLHEALHARSAGLDYRIYPGMRGWEEGVVEQLTRLNRRAMLEDLGEDVAADDVARDVRDRDHPYNGYVFFMERARAMLGDDPRGFYEDLLRVPLAERSARLYERGVDAFEGDEDGAQRWREEFVAIDWYLRHGG